MFLLCGSLQRQYLCGPCFIQYSSTAFMQFLRRKYKQGLHRSDGRDGGLEVPCIVRLYRPKAYIDKMKELVEALFTDELPLCSIVSTSRAHTHI